MELNYPFHQRRNRGTRKHESNIAISKPVRPRHHERQERQDPNESRIFPPNRYNREEKGTKGHRDGTERPGPEPPRRHTYGYELDRKSKGRGLLPVVPKASNVGVLHHVHDQSRKYRQHGRKTAAPVQNRISLPLLNMYQNPMKADDPGIFRRQSRAHLRSSPVSIISSGSRSRSSMSDNTLQRDLPTRDPIDQLGPIALASSSFNAVPPSGIRNFKHKLFTQLRTDADSQEDLKDLPRAPTTKMMEIQLSYVMARQHESSVLLSLQMEEVRNSINAELENLSPNRGNALTTDAIHQLFSMCEYMKLSDPVKYMAVEIYDRFMIAFNAFMDEEQKTLDALTKIEAHNRVKTQARLRIASCVQLASKLVADNTCEPLSSSGVHQDFNFQNFTVRAVSASELRVLTLVKFRLNYITTMDIIEIVLIQLELDIPLYRRIYELCIYLLDYIMEAHEQVYNGLFELENEREPSMSRQQFKQIEFNKLVEASGVIACCIYTFKESEYNIYLHAISSLTQANENTFTDLAAILLKYANEK